MSVSILVAGSLAFDTIMEFSGHFAERLSGHDLTQISTCFYTPILRREFGGCGGNIAFGLRQLGERARLFAAVGCDFAPYAQHLSDCDIDLNGVMVLSDCHTAQCFVTSDLGGNQIMSFHDGALARSHENDLVRELQRNNYDLAIVAPTGKEANAQFSRVLAAANVPFVLDPGQELPLWESDELKACAVLATVLILNEFESKLFAEKTGVLPQSLLGQGSLKAVIVTRGEAPVWLYSLSGKTEIAPPKVDNALDPTGCGDAFRAGFLWAWARGLAWGDCVALGCVLGAIKVQSRGAQHYAADHAHIKQLLKTHYAERAAHFSDWL